jgi:hypothetical protein
MSTAATPARSREDDVAAVNHLAPTAEAAADKRKPRRLKPTLVIREPR